jgi:uncharacterized protein YycO
MRKTRLLYAVLGVLVFLLPTGFVSKSEKPLKNGDIVFIVNPSGQGKAIQLATKSKYTHVGIVLIENGKTMVYHAVEPVSKNTFEQFVAMSADGKYYIKRIKDQSILTREVISKMLSEAKSQLGIHYDLGFNWSDDELYCSEFVWKLYNHALGIDIGKLRPLKDFDLTHPAVKQKLTERYGKNIPLNENMISPGDMYESELLE